VYRASGNKVYALNASTGVKLWTYVIGTASVSSPSVANGVVYIGGGSNVYALNASTGAKLWSYTTGSAVVDTSARSTPERLGPQSSLRRQIETPGEGVLSVMADCYSYPVKHLQARAFGSCHCLPPTVPYLRPKA
jgi:hypothetical protein